MIGDLRHVALTERDAEEAVTLSARAGWNQTAEDWRLMLSAGRGTGVRTATGDLVGTILTLAYGEVHWHAMLLVRSDHQGRGIGSTLFADAVRRSDDEGKRSALDATPQGRPIYERRGFLPLFDIARMVRGADRFPGWSGSSSRPAEQGLDTAEPQAAGPTAPPLRKDLAALERSVLSMDRTDLLPRLAARPHGLVRQRGNSGIALLRSGRIASHLGPVYADSEGDARSMVEDLIDRDRTIFIDVPQPRESLTAWLESCGFAAARSFTRMATVAAHNTSPSEQLFAITGPEYG